MTKYLLLAISIFSTPLLMAQIDPLLQIQVDVVYLASDYLEGRETGTRGEKLAAEYMVNRFHQMGLQPMGDDGTWYQKFPFKELANPHVAMENKDKTGEGMNVVAYLDKGAEHTVVLGAHYDHLGMGDHGSRHVGEPAIHNGADDNASGVAAMLYLAEYLQNSDLNSNNYLFIGFSGEEKGLFGSKYYVEHPTIDLSKVNYMINMDMIGRLNEEKALVMMGGGTSPTWKDAIWKIREKTAIKTKVKDSGIGPSDHTSFYLQEIPVMAFFTGQHMDYHKPEDDSHLVNFEGILEVADYIKELMMHLDDKGKLVYTKAKADEEEQKKVSRFKVTLGVMPDYVFDGEGMKIDGVIEDRPAQKAGLEKGDIVIKMGDVKVTDIYKYMEALGKFKAGQSTTVVVKRKGKKVKKKVVF